MGRPKKFCREEVLDKALPLFWKRGFADTCLQDLEKATGVNKSGLYSEFKDKEDLYLAALRRYVDNMEARKVLDVPPYGWHNIEKFMRAKLECLDGNKGCFAVQSMRETELLHPEAAEIMAEARDRLKKLFLKNIEAGQRVSAPSGQPKMPPEALVEILSTFFSGVCIEQNLKVSKAALVRKIDDFLKVFRQM